MGGLQLLDEFGDEKDLAFEFSPKRREEAMFGCLCWSCPFIWQFVELTNEDIFIDTLKFSGLLSIFCRKFDEVALNLFGEGGLGVEKGDFLIPI